MTDETHEDDLLGRLSKDRLIALIEAYGGDPRRWPVGERALAETALLDYDGDPALSAALEAAHALDDMMDASAAPAPSAALRDRILQAAPVAVPTEARAPARRSGGLSLSAVFARLPRLAPAAGLAVVAMCGVAVGANAPSFLAVPPEEQLAYLSLEGETYTWSLEEVE